MAQIRTSIGITDAADAIEIEMGGTREDIPTILLARTFTGPGLEIHLSPSLLSPAEQVAWLRRLRLRLEELEVLIAQHVDVVTA
jgi:hypothetical protein